VHDIIHRCQLVQQRTAIINDGSKLSWLEFKQLDKLSRWKLKQPMHHRRVVHERIGTHLFFLKPVQLLQLRHFLFERSSIKRIHRLGVDYFVFLRSRHVKLELRLANLRIIQCLVIYCFSIAYNISDERQRRRHHYFRLSTLVYVRFKWSIINIVTSHDLIKQPNYDNQHGQDYGHVHHHVVCANHHQLS
jgi:hypothetical protein